MELKALCERDAVCGASFSQRFPGVPVHTELDDVLNDDSIDAVLIATPPATHHALVKRALEAGKHVLVEKPLATTSADARELIELANRQDLVLMPGHTFVYSPAVNAVRSLLTDGVLGEVYFITSARMNLGKYQRDGVVTDLAPHDLSILMYWLDEPVVQVTTTACTVFQEGVPETAFMTLTFASGTTANIQVSWLAPRKVRQMVVVGSKRMVQYDDTASDEPIRVYDRGMDLEWDAPANFGEYQLTYRSGDVIIPRIDAHEPLALELGDFARAIRTGSTPRSNAALGLEIVSVLEASAASMRRNGAPIVIGPARDKVAA
jgi:predicted dehydrogenase